MAKTADKKKQAEKESKKQAKPLSPPPLPPAPAEDEFKPTDVQEAEAAGKLEPKNPAPGTGEHYDPPAQETPVAAEQPTAPVGPVMPTQPQVDVNLVASVVAAVLELQKSQPAAAAASPAEKVDEIARMQGKTLPPTASVQEAGQARIGSQGVQGVVFKYPVDNSYYADPSERLMTEPRLSRHTLKENYFFRWKVEGLEYEKAGVTYAEPRFILELFRYLDDPETGERNGTMALVARQIQHEDEMFTRLAAIKLGILDKFENFADLMAEIRYLRMRQWLFDTFTPPKIEQHRRVQTKVIGGKAVEVTDTEKRIDGASGIEKAEAVKSEVATSDARI